jgi:hypothetical protein
MGHKRRALAIGAGVAVGAGLSLVVATAVGSQRMRTLYEGEKADLLQRGRSGPPVSVAAGVAARLPPPVRRYLDVTHSLGGPGIRTAILRQSGALRASADTAWMPFEAEQAYSLDPPGFVWRAKARVAPLIGMVARDRFVDGKGNMLIRLPGFITVADGRGPQMDQGAGLRYWGEVIAFPEMVADRHVHWESIDGQRAKMVVDQDGLTLTAVVVFDAQGLPSGFHAERYRDMNGTAVLTPWSGYFRDWQRIDGRLFPKHWESVWHTPQGDLSAVRMAILGLAVE